MNRLPILQLVDHCELKDFIDFWSKIYFYPLEYLYNDTIIKTQYDEDDIQNLFIWKNGMRLSDLKQASVDKKVKTKLNLINNFKRNDIIDIEDFKLNFSSLTMVWKIFVLHIIKPNKFPIYDQNIHRTFYFIHGLDYKSISNTISDYNKEMFYFETYFPFVDCLKNQNLKTLDEAFFAFGQFINTNKYIRFFK